MSKLTHASPVAPDRLEQSPILIRLLGGFQLTKAGCRLPLRQGGKPETFLSSLAVRPAHGVRREQLVCTLWPDRDIVQATQSLNSLVHSLQKLVGDALAGSALVVHHDDRYRLNLEAGVWIDVASFDALADRGDGLHRAGDEIGALQVFARAVQLYRGDLCGCDDTYTVLERERLRERYLTLLTQLADAAFLEGDYGRSLEHVKQLLSTDPCREDAHRRAMRCYVRLGQRGQALRQFRLCEHILQEEFGAVPEPDTSALFDQVRCAPGEV